MEQQVDQIYQILHPPLLFRSNLTVQNDKLQMDLLFENYIKQSLIIEEMLYKINFLGIKKFDKTQYKEIQKSILYLFDVTALHPRSNLKDYQVWVSSELGAKVAKIKLSTTKIELYLDPIVVLQKSNHSEQKSIIGQVVLGSNLGRFKMFYSNKVSIQMPIIYENR